MIELFAYRCILSLQGYEGTPVEIETDSGPALTAVPTVPGSGCGCV